MEKQKRITSECTEDRQKALEAAVATLNQAIPGYLEWMASNGYTQSTRKLHEERLPHFVSFIKSERYCWGEVFTLRTLTRFRQLKGRLYAIVAANLSRYLNRIGKLPAPFRWKELPASLEGSFEDYLHYKRKYHQSPEKPIRACKRVLEAFACHLKKHPIKPEGLKIEQVDAFLADFLEGFSDATRRVYRGHLRGFLSYLFHERRSLSRDLAQLVTAPRIYSRAKPPRFLRPEEVKQLFASLRYETASDLRTAAVVHVAYLLGLRPCEIASLKLDDINFGKAEVCLRQRKNNHVDTLPLPEPVLKAIAAYLIGGRAENEHRNLFLTLKPPPRPLHPNTVCNCVRTCLRKAGLDGSAYRLRHTYAQNLLEAGSSLYEVKEMLGHDSIESTRKYLHIHIHLMRKVLFDETL
jgi:integrase/recombinase XerD